MVIGSTSSKLQDAAFHNFVNFLCFARCYSLSKAASMQGECPIACLMIAKQVLKAWQKSLELADYIVIEVFNNLPELIRLELFMDPTSNKDLSADLTSLASLISEFRNLDKLEIANQREAGQDVFGHCECLILNQASKKYQTRRFHDYIIYVNVEPCLLCASALVTAQVGELYFLAKNEKAGAICSKIDLLDLPWLNHHVTWLKYDLPYLTKSTSKGLQDFFTKLRSRNKGYGSKQQRKQIYKETNKLDFYKSNFT